MSIDKPYRPLAAKHLQQESKSWWTRNAMNYDWRGTNTASEGTREFFQEIDSRFFNASPFFRGDQPFADFIPFARLQGKRVLEVGCGFGSHSQLLAGSGCDLTSIDLTPRAVELTRRRLALSGLSADIREMDAERMEFGDGEFDFVWSWGVIHHSAHTDQIVREVARVLRPGGEFRFMVYNRAAFDSYTKLIRGLITGKTLRGMSMDDILSFYTDGYLARFYTVTSLINLVEANHLTLQKISVVGQTSELIPLPGKGFSGRLKHDLVAMIPAAISKAVLSRTGSFLFAVANKS